MKQQLARGILTVALIGGLIFGIQSHSSAEVSNYDKEKKYLPVANQILKSELGDFEQYGAFYIEHREGLKFVLALSKEDQKTDRLKANLKKQLPADLLVVRSGLKYTSQELKKVNAELARKFPDLRTNGNEIVSSYIDDASNKVIVEAKALTEESRVQLLELYGDMIDIRIDTSFVFPSKAFSRYDDMSVLGGGIAFRTAHGQECTNGAEATKLGVKFMVTAGHCLDGDGQTVWQYNKIVGVDHYTGDTSGGQDIGLIKITDNTRKISNYIFKQSASYYDATFTSTGSVQTGTTVCKSGISTQYTCTTVQTSSYNTVTIDGTIYPDQIKFGNAYGNMAESGDSGSPLWGGNTLYGIVSTAVSGAQGYGTAAKITYTTNLFGSDFKVYTSSTPL